MVNVRRRGEQLRRFILDNVQHHPSDIARIASERFGITRQAVNKHLDRLVNEGAVVPAGTTRSRVYKLAPLLEWREKFPLGPSLAEDIVWREHVTKPLGQLPDNVLNIWHYAFTEMFNNVLDHSDAKNVTLSLKRTAASTEIILTDDGVGIFRKIQAALNLIDERHSVLELAKGKFTTDPANHTGEGIFFTSRVLDKFNILSGGVYFSHEFGDGEDWILETHNLSVGTVVFMLLHNHSARTTKSIFDQYTSGGTLAFTKTIVPVRLAQYGDDSLLSRSQGKRLLARIDRFRTVIFDFSGVGSIGPSFADEIFRVFRNEHPEISLSAINATPEVSVMIRRARATQM
jgi:anti-sigma regulatory factor (Ser/Thr protein kinase)